ncbi:hypothetical protein LTS10_010842 [Elasticomyces elasticus]|nr:hypothetical protein LTS10_010842 [Elasticomyces elasticus]
MSSDSARNLEAVNKRISKAWGFLQRPNKRGNKVQGQSVGESDVRKVPEKSVRSLPSGQQTIPCPQPQTKASRQGNERTAYEQDERAGSEQQARPVGAGSSAADTTPTPSKPQFWRIRNIRSSEVDYARTWVREASEFGCSLAKDSEDSYCATVTSVGCVPPLDRAHWSVDKEFMGITPLADCSDAEVDLVAVTGLAGHALGSFRASSGTFVWLRDALPNDVPQARVLTYGYDTALFENQSKESLYHLAAVFLDRLNSFRRATGTQRRPVCFLGHSLGGVVLKEALTISDLANKSRRDWMRNLDDCGAALYTCGLILFGVPNLGLQHRQLFAMVKGQRNENFIQSLVVNEDNEPSPYLAELTRKFSQLCAGQVPPFEIYSYFETEPSPMVKASPHILLWELDADNAAQETGPRTFEMSDHAMRRELEKWLDPPDPTLNHRRSLKLRTPDTGAWLLEGDNYNRWKPEMPSFLWLYGSAGSGKTILSAGVIHDLQAYCEDDPEQTLAYFYYDFNDSAKQDPVNMIKSLLSQFLEQGVRIPQSLQSCSNMGRSISSDQLLDALHETLRACPASYIVLDALDECTARVDLLDMLMEIHSWSIPTLNLVATSRKDVDIEDRMKKLTTSRGRIYLESNVVDADIRTYVQTRLMREESFRRWQKVPAIRNEIEVTLARKAHGMFRWAACQLDVLAHCPTSRRVRDALNNLPATLNDTYARIIEHIDQGDYGEDALKILRWLVYSEYPLTTEQIMEVTGIFLSPQPHFDVDERYVDARDILRACSSLISMVDVDGDNCEDEEDSEDEDDNEDEEVLKHEEDLAHEEGIKNEDDIEDEEGEDILDKDDSKYEQDSEGEECAMEENVEDEKTPRRYVQLAHFSVKEYLVSKHSLRPGSIKYSLRNAQECHDILGRCCLVYLLRFETEGSIDYDHNSRCPLARYAAKHWGFYHVRAVETVSRQLRELMSRVLSKGSGAFDAWTWLHKPWEGTDAFDYSPCLLESFGGPEGPGPLIAAVYTGAKHVAQIALETLSVDGDTRILECTDALELAVHKGYADIVGILADTGADVNALRGIHGNLLRMAVAAGNRHIVEVLIDKGADINAIVPVPEKQLATPPNGTWPENDEGPGEQLLHRHAEKDPGQRHYGTPLGYASSLGCKEIVKMLLDRGADINAGVGVCGTALQGAAACDHEDIVEMLIKHGANVNAQGKKGSNALYEASLIRSKTIVTMLLDAGADVNALVEGDDYGTALNAASSRSYEDIVGILLDRGAKINATAGVYGTALQIASSYGYSNMVRTLLARGADVHIQGGWYGSALYLALYGGEHSRQSRKKSSKLLWAAGAVEQPSQRDSESLCKQEDLSSDQRPRLERRSTD